MTTVTPAETQQKPQLTEPERKIITLMEQCIRQCELPSQPAELKAAAAAMREHIATYPGYEAIFNVGVPLSTAFRSGNAKTAK